MAPGRLLALPAGMTESTFAALSRRELYRTYKAHLLDHLNQQLRDAIATPYEIRRRRIGVHQ